MPPRNKTRNWHPVWHRAVAPSDRRLAARLDQFDCDPWPLNCPSCTIELQNGLPRAHRTEDYTVDPALGVDCPLWRTVLDRLTASDRQYRAFLQRMAG